MEVQHKKIDKKKMMLKLLLSLLLIVVIVLIFYFVFKKLGWTSLSKQQIQEKIASFGAFGPLVFILVSFLQVTIIPIPSTITILSGSYLFGCFFSFIYSYIGIILGSLFAFFLGRKIGRPFVNWIVGDKQTVEYYLKKLKGKEVILLFFMFLLPFFPDDALCSIAGILPISFSLFLFIQIITRFIAILATLIFMSGEIIPFSGWGIPVLIILGILILLAFIFAYKNSNKINDKLVLFVDKHFKKRKNNK